MKDKNLTIDELLQVIRAVKDFEPGESYEIKCHVNDFLLTNKDIKVLLDYIEFLEEKVRNKK